MNYSENIEFAMATRVAAVGEMTSVEEMERRLVWLVEQVEREKEKTRDTFQQLHSLLTVREEGLLVDVVVDTRTSSLNGTRQDVTSGE